MVLLLSLNDKNIAKCILLSCKLLISFLIPYTIFKTKSRMKLH